MIYGWPVRQFHIIREYRRGRWRERGVDEFECAVLGTDEAAWSNKQTGICELALLT